MNQNDSSLPMHSDIPRESVDFFQSGKFTFEPNAKHPVHNIGIDIAETGGVSFGMSTPHKLNTH